MSAHFKVQMGALAIYSPATQKREKSKGKEMSEGGGAWGFGVSAVVARAGQAGVALMGMN